MKGPIFIAASPRSGTTLLRNMLNRHPEIAMCRETGFFHYVYSRRARFGDLREAQNRERLVNEYTSVRRVKRMRLNLDALRSRLMREATSYQAFFTTMLAFAAESQGKSMCGEKTPHTSFLGTLLDWYPDATIVHLLRDPRDVVASLLRMPWASDSVITNARVWLHDNRRAFQWRNHRRYIQVRYEELVREPERHLRRICEFAGTSYSPSMLTPAPDPTADRPWFRRAEEPVTTARSGKWAETLSSADVSLVEWVVGSDMGTFEYECRGPRASLAGITKGLAFSAYDSVRRSIGEFPGAWLYLTKSLQLAKEEAAKDRFRFRGDTAAVK